MGSRESVDNQNPPSPPNSPIIVSGDSSGEGSPSEKKEALKHLLSELISEIESSCKDSLIQIIVSFVICVGVLGFGFWLGFKLYTYKEYPPAWTWQMIYFTSIRIVIVSGYFYLMNFCFKIFKSYLHIHQRNRHRRFVIKSMSNLIAASDINIVKEVYIKILEIITGFDDTGLLIEDKESINPDIVEKIIKIIPIITNSK